MVLATSASAPLARLSRSPARFRAVSPPAERRTGAGVASMPVGPAVRALRLKGKKGSRWESLLEQASDAETLTAHEALTRLEGLFARIRDAEHDPHHGRTTAQELEYILGSLNPLEHNMSEPFKRCAPCGGFSNPSLRARPARIRNY